MRQYLRVFKHIDKDKNEFWYARELMKAIGYSKWSNFASVLEKAKSACKLSKKMVYEHFSDVSKTIKMPKGATKRIEDYRLSRYACYLIVQNSDSRKETVALGQTYFVVQTRK